MKKLCTKNIIIIFAIIIILAFAACTKYNDIESNNTNSPEYTEQPFFASTQEATGGDGLTGLNLADIKLENLDNDQSKITLSFMYGSGATVVDQQVSPGVPDFAVTHLEGVDRMVIKLDGITGWTYKIYEDEIVDNRVVNGILKQEPVNSGSFYLYVSTKDEYQYRVDTYENKIIITCKHIGEIENYKYYIKINAFSQYQNGGFTTGDFSPCLSSDGTHGVLISNPFDTLNDAQFFLDSVQTNITQIILPDDISIIYLGNNELPEYDYENQLEQIVNSPIGINGNKYILGEPLITEGRFLAWNSIGDEFVYARAYTMIGSEQGDTFSYEEIRIRTKDGDFQLADQQFTSVLSAAYSYDDRYIAFIDQNDETRMLQIADADTGNVFIPADYGFGIDTSSFVWSNNDNRLFAITGERNSKQLLCYDLQNATSPQVCALTEEEYMESVLCLFDESIYYLKSDGDNLKTSIYKADIETGHAVKLLSGNSFMLSPDGKNVLVNDMQYDNVDEYSFYTYVNKTGAKHIIESGKMIMDYTWSADSTRVYYTVYKNAGWEEEFPLQLYYYDINTLESHYVMDMITGALYTAQQDNEVLVMSIFQLQDKQITITYKVK